MTNVGPKVDLKVGRVKNVKIFFVQFKKNENKKFILRRLFLNVSEGVHVPLHCIYLFNKMSNYENIYNVISKLIHDLTCSAKQP